MSAISDPIGDFLTRLRNASRANKHEVVVPYSKLKEEMSRILKQEGYIVRYKVEKDGPKGHILIEPKFVDRTPAITGLKRVSRPGLRRYVGAREIPRVLGGMGISILSTSHGIVTDREARNQNIGGELLAFVW
jgi:small subunit ribosomal protein S8